MNQRSKSIIEAEWEARWDAILGRDIKEDKSDKPLEQKEQDERTLGRTVPSENN